MRARPTKLLLALAALPCVPAAIFAIWFPGSQAVFAGWLLVTAVLVLVSAVDLYRARRPLGLRFEREHASNLSLGVDSKIRLRARIESGRIPAAEMVLWDEIPASATSATLPLRVRPEALETDSPLTLTYTMRPLRRGDHHFGRLRVWSDSPWRLWSVLHRLAEPTEVRVLPNFRALAQGALVAVQDRAGVLGARLQRQRGLGLDFRELRDYREGDLLRQVDWKATARHHKPISREYQIEKDQHVVFLLDCGRRMAMRAGEIQHFDHALDAVLLTTWVALRQGDSVGLSVFGGAERWLRPAKSRPALQRLLSSVYDLEPTLEAPDFVSAALDLVQRQRRRALVILVTDLRDEDGEEVRQAVRLLEHKHLVLLASLREPAIDELLSGPVDGTERALELAATHLYLQGRDATVARLRASGVSTLDVAPDHLPLALVQRYLQIKRAASL